MKNLTQPLIASTVVFAMTGCELLGPDIHQKLPLDDPDPMTLNEQEILYDTLSNQTTQELEQQRLKPELYPGTNSPGHPQITSDKGVNNAGEYSLNFDDADLAEVSKVILADILNVNYVLSPKVAGRVTLQTSKPLSKVQLIPTLEMLLELNGAALIEKAGVYRILPASEAMASGGVTLLSNGKLGSGYQVMAVPVHNVAVGQLIEVIRPLVQDKAVLNIDKDNNILLIAGNREELIRALELVRIFDVNQMKGRSFGLFPVYQVDAVKIIEELDHIFNSGKKGELSSYQFMPIERLNAVLAMTYKAELLQDVERWVTRLDRSNNVTGGGAIVYRAQHVDAVKLSETLNEIFAVGQRKKTTSAVAPGKTPVTVTNKTEPSSNKKPMSEGIQMQKENPSISELGNVRIIADEVNNALIIVATAQEYAVIEKVIKQLDIMPLQVLIEATIVAVQLTDDLKYGIRWYFSHNNSQNAGGLQTEGLSDVLGITASKLALGAATGGFGYAFVSDSKDVIAVLNAAADDNKINVISSPSLMVLNNQEASIQVGDEVPIRTSESTNTSSSIDPIQTSSIQMRETGVSLMVKPRVNANGLVIMDVEQSVDKAIPSDTSAIDSPTIQQRKIKSQVAVQSGETIVLGGLIDETDSLDKGGIPFLYELPVVGPLFGSTSKSKVKTELVVLITPRVVNTRGDARMITDEFKRRLTGIYEEPSIEPEIQTPQ
jgi:general secretion pathway protein D